MTSKEKPAFADLVDLAAARLGGRALQCSDDFFAPMDNMLKGPEAVFIADKYTSRGKWMDGWESRRKRTPGHDWCVVKLGLRGIVRGVDVDTSFFTGNFPSHASLEARDGKGEWQEILPKTELKGNGHNWHEIKDDRAWTHLRLNIFPDGGVARFRVHGEVVPDWKSKKGLVDLASVENGARAVSCSDKHYSHPNNLLMPGRSKNMGDGWETKRRRGPGHDWCVIKLGRPGLLEKVEVDTNWFKGNYPESCSLEGGPSENGPWTTILARTKLKAHKRHHYKVKAGPFEYVRLSMYPDGGISRLRIHGRP
jgi:allantoicase